MAVIPSTHTKRPSLELKLPAVLPLYKKPYNTAVVNMIAQMPNKEPPNMLQIGRNQMAELINKSKESAEQYSDILTPAVQSKKASPAAMREPKQKVFEFPIQNTDSPSNANNEAPVKNNNALNPRKTFHGAGGGPRSPSPIAVESEGGESIRIPTINNKFQKGVNNQELMVQTLYTAFRTKDSTSGSQMQNYKTTTGKSPSSRNTMSKQTAPVVAPASTKDSKSQFTIQQQSTTSMYKPHKKRNSDDLAHLIEPHITSGTTVVMDVASPFRNQALSNRLAGVPNAAGFKQQSPSQQGLVPSNSFQFQIASSLYLHNPQVAAQLQRKLLNQLPLTEGGPGPKALKRDVSNGADFMTMEQYQRVIEETETLLMGSEDPYIAKAALDHRRSRIALQVLSNDESVVHTTSVGSPINVLCPPNEKTGQWEQSNTYSYIQDSTERANMKEVLLNQSSAAFILKIAEKKASRKARQRSLANNSALIPSTNPIDYKANPITTFPMLDTSFIAKNHDGPALIGMPSMVGQQQTISTQINDDSPHQQPGFMFTSPHPQMRRISKQRAQATTTKLLGMKKNLKLIREDRAREKKSEQFAKFYEKLKISLEPIAEQMSTSQINHNQSTYINEDAQEIVDTLEQRLMDLQAHHDAYLLHISQNQIQPMIYQPSVETLVQSPQGARMEVYGRQATHLDSSFSSNIHSIAPLSTRMLPPLVKEIVRRPLMHKPLNNPPQQLAPLKLAKIGDIPNELLDQSLHKKDLLSPHHQSDRKSFPMKRKKKASRNNTSLIMREQHSSPTKPIISPKQEYSVMTHQQMVRQEEVEMYRNFGNVFVDNLKNTGYKQRVKHNYTTHNY